MSVNKVFVYKYIHFYINKYRKIIIDMSNNCAYRPLLVFLRNPRKKA